MALYHGSGGETEDLQLACKAVGFLALLTALVYLWTALAGGLDFAGLGNVQTDGGLVFGLMLGGAAGLLLGWRYKRTGGAVALLCGALLAVLVYVNGPANPLLAAMAYSSPFIIAGLLYVLAGCRGQ